MARFWGKEGASAGLVLLVSLEALGYALFWMRSYPGEFPLRQILSKLPKSLLLSLMSGLLALDITESLSGSSLSRLVLGGAAAVTFYLVAGMAWGLEELDPVRQKLSRLSSRLIKRG